MKPTSFNYADYAKLQIDMERKNEYVNALIAENARLQKQLAAYEDIGTVEDFQRLMQAQNEGWIAKLSEKMIIEAVRKSILVNTDETKYRYELGKDCLEPCCKDVVKYLRWLTCEEAAEALKEG